jgi:hypothetical protein
VTEFHDVYLPGTYSSISAFNSANGTSYTAFSQVPAATPGQALASVYQKFRVWSVQTVYGQLTSDVRAATASTPLYYYFGGHIGNGADYANIPDLFFSLAKKYTVTMIEDAAQSPGLALLFGSLGRAGRAVDRQLRHGPARGRRRGLLHPRRHPEGRRRVPDLHELGR